MGDEYNTIHKAHLRTCSLSVWNRFMHLVAKSDDFTISATKMTQPSLGLVERGKSISNRICMLVSVSAFLSACLPAYLSVSLFVWLSVCLSVFCLSVCRSIFLSAHLCLSVCLFCLTGCLSVRSAYLSACLSALSACRSAWLSASLSVGLSVFLSVSLQLLHLDLTSWDSKRLLPLLEKFTQWSFGWSWFSRFL